MVQQIVDRRRRESKVNGSDLLSILLTDPLFSTNDEIMVDELLTIFFAGSQTTSVASSNLILHLLEHPKYRNDILEELDQ